MSNGRYEKEKQRANQVWNEFFDMVSKKKEAHENFMKYGKIPPEDIILYDRGRGVWKWG